MTRKGRGTLWPHSFPFSLQFLCLSLALALSLCIASSSYQLAFPIRECSDLIQSPSWCFSSQCEARQPLRNHPGVHAASLVYYFSMAALSCSLLSCARFLVTALASLTPFPTVLHISSLALSFAFPPSLFRYLSLPLSLLPPFFFRWLSGHFSLFAPLALTSSSFLACHTGGALQDASQAYLGQPLLRCRKEK